jgi:hypothetical protein
MNEDKLRELYARELSVRPPAEAGACPGPEALLAVAERRGSEAHRLGTLDHVMACEACKRDFELLRSARVARDTLEREQEAPPIFRFRPRTALALAAVLATVIAGGALFRQMTAGDSGTIVRGGGAAISVVSPPEQSQVGGDLLLVWRPLAQAARYEVEILQADGSVLGAWTTTDTVFVVPNGIAIVAGEYQWWVRSQAPNGSGARSAIRRFTVTER